MEVAGMVVAEAAAFTEAAASAEVAAISVVAELDRVLVEAPVPAAQAVFAVVHLARMREEGRELTAIALTVRDPMGCTGEEAQLHLVHVTGQRRGTEQIRG
jgi:hypothetical protein